MTALFLLFLLIVSGPVRAAETVTVYAYDSFAAKGALGPIVRDAFQKKYGGKTEIVSFPSAGEALNQIALEGKATPADLLVGVDESLLSRAREIGAFEKLDPKLESRVPEELRFDGERKFLPIDYGYLTFVYDSRRTASPEASLSLREMARSKRYKKKIVIEDPRTSSIGLSFLLWSRALFPSEADWSAFWKDMAGQLVTISPGWSGAYGLFLKREADFVVSYTTSPAYHVENEKTDAFRAVIFSEGNFRQIEAAAIVRHSKRKDAAKRWMELLLSDEIQSRVPTTQWMYPVVKNVTLPKSFQSLPKVKKALSLDPALVGRSKREWLRAWWLSVVEAPVGASSPKTKK